MKKSNISKSGKSDRKPSEKKGANKFGPVFSFNVGARMDAYTRADGTQAIYLLVIVNGKRRKLPLKLYARANHWDAKKCQVKPSAPGADELNMIIAQQVGRANDIAVRHRLQSIPLSVAKLVELLGSAAQSACFLTYMRAQITIREAEIKPRTIAHHVCTLGKLSACFPEGLTTSAIDHHAVERFRNYMIRHGLGPNTITGNLKRWKIYIHRAMRDDIITRDPFEHMPTRYHPGDRTSLTRDELGKLEALYTSAYITPTMGRTLQCFLFSCYTGLRVGDISQVCRQNIINNEITIMPKKTEGFVKVVRIPLNRQAKEYLNISHEEWKFDMPAEPTMNELLKDAARITGIPKKITYHVSRHTFATLFLASGGTLDTLQKLMGHADISTTMIYVHVSDARKREQIEMM